MFSSALKSLSSNISSAYSIAPQPSSTSGPWKIFDAKRKATGKAASVFVFDRRSLEAPSGALGARGSSSALKRAHDEVVERLRREASSLARLRHPSILELAEPVEETRNGGLMFATEPVTASLAGLLLEKDEQERALAVGGRGSRYVVEESDGTRRRRELEIDELEIQKGLLQLGKGLEFLHESAGLVHANLTPEAVFINAKGDWKISGLAFCGPHANTTAATSLAPISLSEVLNHDPRLPSSVQLNIDYTSPDFVLDNNLSPAADMFSLGLLVISLYNLPHSSPLSTGSSLSAYKRAFASSSSVPTQGNNFLVPSSRPLPPKLASELLPRLITRRPAQRLSAREFGEASYFDNILVATIRFLDALPAKTSNEKAQFMRGLPRIVSQFPKSVLGQKVLPALLEEMKDRELLAPIISNVFVIINLLPTGKRAFAERVLPRLRDVFLAGKAGERDPSSEPGLMVLLENMSSAAEHCPGKEFRDDLLSIIIVALESPTHGIVDAALGTLPSVLPLLDYTAIKNELFPVIANGFAKTSSLMIKIRCLDAFYTLCGGTASSSSSDDDLDGIGIHDKKPSATSSSALDKFTVQEKVVPLLKGIKTKEPGVMMAALRVFTQVGQVADSDFLAIDVLPALWAMSLGPLLNLQQFQAFMSLINSLGSKIEREQTRKLKELGSSGAGAATGVGARGGRDTAGSAAGLNGLSGGDESDFETLVSGRKPVAAAGNDLMDQWAVAQPSLGSRQTSQPRDSPTFAWQTSPPKPSANTFHIQAPAARTVTPDLSSFAALSPAASQFSQPLQPGRPGLSTTTSARSVPLRPAQQTSTVAYSNNNTGTSIDWSAAAGGNSSASAWASQTSHAAPAMMTNGFGSLARSPTGSFALPPPPTSPAGVGQFGAVPPLQATSQWTAAQAAPTSQFGRQQQQQQPRQPKSGLDQYESLL